MTTLKEDFLLVLLQACAATAPQPLYPVHFARETNLDREVLDEGLDELRRRGLIKLTEWVKGSGQGCALTDEGERALAARRLPASRAPMPGAAPAATPGYSRYERGEIIRSIFLDPHAPYVSRALLALNILYFLFGAFLANQDGQVGAYLHGSGKTTGAILVRLGALRPDLVFDTRHPGERPQYERIILASFLHGGLLHLGMNMYFLATLGPLIERMWGRYRFLVIYLVADVVSGCLVIQLTLLQYPDALIPLVARELPVTIGASGALYGIFLALFVWFLLNKEYLPPRLVESWSRTFGLNIVLLLGLNFLPGISWQGHLGGAIGGLLTALLLHVQRFYPNRLLRILAVFGVLLVPVVFFVMMLWQAGRL